MQIVDVILSHLNSQFCALKSVVNDFNFLTGKSLKVFSAEDIKRHATDLALKYDQDLDAFEFANEIDSFRFQVTSHIEGLESPKSSRNFKTY